MSLSSADRFRHWYDYECDCNSKVFAMLHSVAVEQQGSAMFQRALDIMAHAQTARCLWLSRFGVSSATPDGLFPQGISLTELEVLLQQTQAPWRTYFETLDEQELTREVEYRSTEGSWYRWSVEGALTQLQGHALYHRGQIALLVEMLGGVVEDTDYVFWVGLTPLDGTF